jgi:serine/threonine-protein kinase RsbW
VPVNSLPLSAPHTTADELHRWTLDSFGGLRGLRAALREQVCGESPSEELQDVCDRITVVATELATNALRHGLPPTLVRLLREGDRLILDVADHDLSAAPAVDDRPLGAGGLGLKLTKTFAIDLGWYRTDIAKHVWASFPG